MKTLIAAACLLGFASAAHADPVLVMEQYVQLQPSGGVSVRALCPPNQRAVTLRIITPPSGPVLAEERNCANGRIGLNYQAPWPEPFTNTIPVDVQILSEVVYKPKMKVEYDCVSSINTGCVYQGGRYAGVLTWSGDKDWIRIATNQPPMSVTSFVKRSACKIAPSIVQGIDGQWYITVAGGPAGCEYEVQVLPLY